MVNVVFLNEQLTQALMRNLEILQTYTYWRNGTGLRGKAPRRSIIARLVVYGCDKVAKKKNKNDRRLYRTCNNLSVSLSRPETLASAVFGGDRSARPAVFGRLRTGLCTVVILSQYIRRQQQVYITFFSKDFFLYLRTINEKKLLILHTCVTYVIVWNLFVGHLLEQFAQIVGR